jgi:hypothetical protein
VWHQPRCIFATAPAIAAEAASGIDPKGASRSAGFSLSDSNLPPNRPLRIHIDESDSTKTGARHPNEFSPVSNQQVCVPGPHGFGTDRIKGEGEA